METALRVLLLEDEPTDAELMVHELRAAGYAVTWERVESREGFVAAAETFKPDIVLADYTLPEFDGRTALNHMRRAHPEVPVIIVTGTLIDEDAIELVKEGARDYVLKTNLVRLAPSVRRALAEEAEVAARKWAEEQLRLSEICYRRLFETAKDGIMLLNAMTGEIDAVNPALLQVLSRKPAELLGRRLWEIRLFPDEAAGRKVFSDLQQYECVRFDDLVLTNNGHIVDLEFVGSCYSFDPGKEKVVQCNIRDVTNRKQAELQIRQALDEKTIMLREIHHRVKNNLQIILSLLSLQIDRISNEEALQILLHCKNRVRAIALVHEMLYKDKDLSGIDVREYVSSLAEHISAMYKASFPDVRVELELDNVFLSLEKSIPCGLIANELLTNAYKHAFSENTPGTIRVALRREDGGIVLRVSDNGRGLPASCSLHTEKSLGLELVSALTDQLHGSLDIAGAGGTAVTVRFPHGESGDDRHGAAIRPEAQAGTRRQTGDGQEG